MRFTHRLAALFITVAMTAVPTLAHRVDNNRIQKQGEKVLLNRSIVLDNINEFVAIGGDRFVEVVGSFDRRLDQVLGGEIRNRARYTPDWRGKVLVAVYNQRARSDIDLETRLSLRSRSSTEGGVEWGGVLAGRQRLRIDKSKGRISRDGVYLLREQGLGADKLGALAMNDGVESARAFRQGGSFVTRPDLDWRVSGGSGGLNLRHGRRIF